MPSEKWVWCSRSLTVSALYQVAWVVLLASTVLGKYPRSSNDLSEKLEGYKFGYKSLSHHGDQWRAETSDGKGTVIGSYGYMDGSGFRREVKYVADEKGFRVKVDTNEPGMEYRSNPASVILKTPRGNVSEQDVKKEKYSQAVVTPELKEAGFGLSGITYHFGPANIVVRAKAPPAPTKENPQGTEVVDYYTIYAFSENPKPVVLPPPPPGRATQSPWFPINVVN